MIFQKVLLISLSLFLTMYYILKFLNHIFILKLPEFWWITFFTPHTLLGDLIKSHGFSNSQMSHRCQMQLAILSLQFYSSFWAFSLRWCIAIHLDVQTCIIGAIILFFHNFHFLFQLDISSPNNFSSWILYLYLGSALLGPGFQNLEFKQVPC